MLTEFYLRWNIPVINDNILLLSSTKVEYLIDFWKKGAGESERERIVEREEIKKQQNKRNKTENTCYLVIFQYTYSLSSTNF
jgi:hypothetical protein